MVLTISSPETSIPFSQNLVPSKGMYSMNLTVRFPSCAILAKSRISDSLQPLVTTQFIFTGERPTLSASSIPAITFQNMSFVPVIWS